LKILKAGKKIQNRLNARLKAHAETLGPNVRHDTKVSNRIDSGGYRKPGSRKKG
jgi:hypothetical protein